MTTLNWFWIVLMMTAPPVIALALAFPLWRKSQVIFGNIVGTAVIFVSAFAMIFREYAEIDIVVQRCLDVGVACFPQPSAFTRFAIYAFIGLIEVFALFGFSLRVEERRRDSDYAPEWR